MTIPRQADGGRAAEAGAPAGWAPLVPADQWNVFLRGVDALARAGVPLLLHGAMALATYTGRWRNTKDVDVVVHPRDRERAVAALREAGFADYFARETYDRSWIFRGWRDEVIFDVIWALPNHRVPIDDAWFRRAPPVRLRERVFAVVPPEELVRVKLYVFQRECCDWVDVLNVLAAAWDRLDWHWLVERMDRELPLLHAAVAIFNWISPGRARGLPPWLRAQFALEEIPAGDPEEAEARRAALFDCRPWFALHQPLDRPLER